MFRGLFILAIGSVVASSQAFSLFDFESSPVTSNFSGSTGGYTSLAQTDGGLTLTITRSGGARFDVFDNPTMGLGNSFPLTWEGRSLSPFFASSTNDYFVGNFSMAVNAVELEGLDFSPDSDTLVMEVWTGLNGTGTLLATKSNFWGTQIGPNYVGVGWNGGNTLQAQSILFRGGSTAAPQSMFIDNIAATAVPEPATIAALGLGAAAMIRRRRRSK
jgi:PEP-CTERM motif